MKNKLLLIVSNDSIDEATIRNNTKDFTVCNTDF